LAELLGLQHFSYGETLSDYLDSLLQQLAAKYSAEDIVPFIYGAAEKRS
jgi:hypothetical protein